MESLFEQVKHSTEPLAARMRPRNIYEYIGQDHIIGKGRLLRRAIAADQLTSVIFYGPPGTGKTTLARVIANHTKSNFITLNAVLTGVADIRGAIKQAEDYYSLYSRRTILFVDEVHRWNKSQQDALLPWVENGTIILIGATTENPFFEVNKALVSRSRVFQLKPLTPEDLKKAAEQAISDTERGYGHWKIVFEEGALEHLIETANGDARSLLNALELAVETTPEQWNPKNDPPIPSWGSQIYISKEACEESIQKKVVLYDRDGDYHYDIISAFIKSLRGRDPDAALYWLARMVRAGEDPHFIFRRMLISACEDTGMADPYAISVVNSCAESFDRVGMPEGNYFLAHAAIYLSTAPKSNSSMAFFDALDAVNKEDADVPNHLKDNSRDAEGFGHGKGYLYPHAYRDHWIAQQYLPDTLMGRVFYTPSTQGYEGKIRSDVLSRREIQISSILEKDEYAGLATSPQETGSINKIIPNKIQKSEFGANPISEWWINEHFKCGDKKEENLTFSPKDQSKEIALDRADRFWRQRLDSNKSEVLLNIRDTLITMADIKRHHRSLIWNADSGLLLWEIARKTPEGYTCGICKTEKGKQILEQYSRTLGDLDRPKLLVRPEKAPKEYLSYDDFHKLILDLQYSGTIFDRLFFVDPFVNEKSINELAASIKRILENKIEKDEDLGENFQIECPFSKDFSIILSQKIPSGGQKISKLVKEQILNEQTLPSFAKTIAQMEVAEKEFFEDKENALFNWNEQTIVNQFEKNGFKVECAEQVIAEKRRISKIEIEKWFNPQTSAYGNKLFSSIEKNDLQKIINLLEVSSEKTIFNWQSKTVFVKISLK